MNRPEVTRGGRWHFPKPEVMTLPNGLAVWAFDLPGQHVAALELVLPTPLQHEPRAVEGVATVALNCSDEGTRSHPAGAIAEMLERQGAALGGSAGQAWTRIGGDAPVHRLPAVVELFTEVLREPDYRDDDVAHHVELQVAAFESRLASPESVARQAFRTALFGDDSREGRPAAGTPETLGQVDREAVLAWHGRAWAPEGATLILAGDLSGTDLASCLAPLHAWDIPGVQQATTETPKRSPRVVVVDMPEAVQVTIQAGCLTVGRRHPDWAALKLGGHVLAGAFASRLNLELRERRGFTYGINGSVGARRHDGQFSIGGSFRTEVAAEAAAAIRAALDLAEPFTDAEVEDARRYLIGIAPLANETAADIARQAAALAAGGETAGFVNEHFAALERPTAVQVTEVWRRHVTSERLTMALSGPAAHLLPALEAAGVEAVRA